MKPLCLRSHVWGAFLVAISLALGRVEGVRAAGFPPAAELPAQAALPDPLVRVDGRRVSTWSEWYAERRPELRALFQHYMYGFLPPAPARVEATLERQDTNYFGGRATKKELALRFGPPGTPAIHLLLVVPNGRRAPAPVFLGLNFCGNHTTLDDPTIAPPSAWMPDFCPGCSNHVATAASRGRNVADWSIEPSIARGYAVATFYNGEVDPDRNEFSDGVHPHFPSDGRTARGPHTWGSIAAWAWGLHRAVDYLVTDPDIDRGRIAVFGHSRNGKTALVAGAFDDRIALIVPHQAGCGGTAPSRGKVGESVRQINDRFPHWFCEQFRAFNDAPDRLPFDQHALIALCAPRPVLLSNAVEDTWANPAGQFAMLQAADPVYRFLGAGGLEADAPPSPGHLVASRLGYFLRPGKHSTTPEDWHAFLDFADAHLGRPTVAPR